MYFVRVTPSFFDFCDTVVLITIGDYCCRFLAQTHSATSSQMLFKMACDLADSHTLELNDSDTIDGVKSSINSTVRNFLNIANKFSPVPTTRRKIFFFRNLEKIMKKITFTGNYFLSQTEAFK